MLTWRRTLLVCSMAFAWSLSSACSGVDPNAKINSPPLVDDGGAQADATTSGDASGGSSSSGGGVGSGSGGGLCGNVTCVVDDDCLTKCGPPQQFGYVWCCSGASGCFQWSTTCPGEGPAPRDAGGQ